MRRIFIISTLFLLIGGPAFGQAYSPSFKPDTLKGPQTGRPNEVLVLGSTHLSSAPSIFQPAMLAPLLDRLATWEPTAIATESMSGIQCQELRGYPSRYANTVKTYCRDTSAAEHATGLDVFAANTEAERLLDLWPKAPRANDRRHLAAVFLAAGEPASALVQWLRLPVSERHPGNGLNQELIASLKILETRRNETYLIGAVLAARLGLERLWSVDDHSADRPDTSSPEEQKAAQNALTAAWNNPFTQARQAEDAHMGIELQKPNGILSIYRALNVPSASLVVYHSDFGAALEERSPQQVGRHYVGYWETRNLRMVSNIRSILGRYPGTRMLAIVGASHKGYYEAYLNQMHDVRLVNAADILK